MSTPILATKLYIPPVQPKVVRRPRLIERLNEGLHGKLTLISAPAGFGKTTLVSEWIDGCKQPVAWLSLDEGDNDPTRFLVYLVAALQTLALSPLRRTERLENNIGKGVLGMLQSLQPPTPESILTALLNEITTIPDNFILVLDDYHVIESKPVDYALTFLLEHLPPQMHLVIATREDPNLPLARLRVQGQLIELRITDLRFTASEAAKFLNQVMGLNLSSEYITALETRTEGWIAGLQLAAISMQGCKDTTRFIKSFTGSHHFVMDYLVEEVLHQQSESVQNFLLCTSILDRMCGSLCDAVLLDPSVSGQKTLEYLEHSNLFIVPLDNERLWYRYHHLFADFLRQRLHQNQASSTIDIRWDESELHKRASVWYEDNAMEIEAFHHAAKANDIERTARLIEGNGMPLQFRGAVTPVLNWLKSLPTAVLDAKPSLWVMYASTLSMTGQTTGVEEKLQSAEAALQGSELDDKTRNLIGHIAAIRALLAAVNYKVDTIIAQSHRALEYLHPDNLAVRTATIWKMGIAYQIQGNRLAASQAYTEAISICQATGNNIINISATTGLGQVQESENQLLQAAQTYRRVLELAGDPPQLTTCEAYLGLARIFYEWNDLDTAEQYAQKSIQLAKQIGNSERFVPYEVFLARLKLAQGDLDDAVIILARAEQFIRQYNFMHRMPEVAAAQVLTLLHQGNLDAAAQLAQTYELPIIQARVYLARGEMSEALELLEPMQRRMEEKGWQDELLKILILQAVAHYANGEKEKAAQLLSDTLTMAEPGGFIRIFVDEGLPTFRLLTEAFSLRIMPDYTGKLLVAFENEEKKKKDKSSLPAAQRLLDPLSQRELEVLQLIAQGLSNHEISERLFLALSTVKGHIQKIFDKLDVQRRTEAVARARELGLL